MKKVILILTIIVIALSCSRDDIVGSKLEDNPIVTFNIPADFPNLNNAFKSNKPTKYGVELGEKLFHEKRFSGNNTISCASCHNPAFAFSDGKMQAVGIDDRVGFRNTPPLQNLAFMKFYNWDGNILELEKQPLVPIITHEEMNSSILEVIGKIKGDFDYKVLFKKAFGDENVTPERIYKSIATLRSMGVKDIILDPGFGFAKTVEQNYELLYRVNELHYFELPILGGISRKSMIYKKIGITAQEALNGTTALNTLLLERGVQILRVHDVKEAKQLVDLFYS